MSKNFTLGPPYPDPITLEYIVQSKDECPKIVTDYVMLQLAHGEVTVFGQIYTPTVDKVVHPLITRYVVMLWHVERTK